MDGDFKSLDEVLTWAKDNPPSEEDLKAQAESYARNYKPGPRQAEHALWVQLEGRNRRESEAREILGADFPEVWEL